MKENQAASYRAASAKKCGVAPLLRYQTSTA